MERVLVVEDDPLVQRSMLYCLQRHGFLPEAASSFHEAEILLAARDFQLVVTDYRLAGPKTGLDLLAYLQARKPGIPVIMVSGSMAQGIEEAATRLGADAFFPKPLDMSSFLAACTDALTRHRRATRAG